MIKSFTAYEYHSDTCFYPAEYSYQGSLETGWVISRNQKRYLTLPRGYVMVETLGCGICSTDLSRHHLPFPLPQIIGHEVVIHQNGSLAVVDINATHKNSNSITDCPYCSTGLENHCPDRLTLGIDRLPGGFAPFILVPEEAIVSLPENYDVKLASIIEPFAAALHAIETEDIKADNSVAIVGPRRLGGLLILALNLWRKKNNIDVNIVAVIRREQMRNFCQHAGADEVYLPDELDDKKFDFVFDTSGSVSGLALALNLAKNVVHVKTTNGQPVFGLTCLTEMVINEQKLLPFFEPTFVNKLSYRENIRIIVDPLSTKELIERIKLKLPKAEIVTFAMNELGTQPNHFYDRFDVAISMSVEFINRLIEGSGGVSLLKPKSNIYLSHINLDDSVLKQALGKNIAIHTSRCGNFQQAIKIISEDISLAKGFVSHFISDIYKSNEIEQAFVKARTDRLAVKVLVECVN